MLFSLRDTGFHAKKRGNAPLLIGRIKIIILFGRKHSSTMSLKGITESLNMHDSPFFAQFCVLHS